LPKSDLPGKGKGAVGIKTEECHGNFKTDRTMP
jgi:hypothetical protein